MRTISYEDCQGCAFGFQDFGGSGFGDNLRIIGTVGMGLGILYNEYEKIEGAMMTLRMLLRFKVLLGG